ncbi:integral membrane protein [Rhypophila decipiens]
MAPSNLTYLPHVANLIGTIFIGFGMTAILRPTDALTFFEYHALPTNASDQKMVHSLLAVYGVRDIFMGLAIYMSSWTGTRKSLGWMLILASAVAFADGYITLGTEGNVKGEWNHWGYAPVLTGLGAMLVGVFDGR